MKEYREGIMVRLRMKDCGRGENGNRVVLADGKGSSADGKRLREKVIR